MNLGTARIVIVVALIAVGAVVLSQGFAAERGRDAHADVAPPSDEPTDEPTDTGSPTPTDEPTEDAAPNTSGVLFMTLNGTDVPGSRAAAGRSSYDDGYEQAGDADNAREGRGNDDVYYRGGADADAESSGRPVRGRRVLRGARSTKLGRLYQDVVPASATIVIVVGQDYADAQAAASCSRPELGRPAEQRVELDRQVIGSNGLVRNRRAPARVDALALLRDRLGGQDHHRHWGSAGPSPGPPAPRSRPSPASSGPARSRRGAGAGPWPPRASPSSASRTSWPARSRLEPQQPADIRFVIDHEHAGHRAASFRRRVRSAGSRDPGRQSDRAA